jgi:hypothetical protein
VGNVYLVRRRYRGLKRATTDYLHEGNRGGESSPVVAVRPAPRKPEPPGDLHLNGAATQGENIADLGGIMLGWDAFTKTEGYRGGKPIGGLTPAER